MAKLPRLPLSRAHRLKLAEARVGVPKSEAHRKALSDSQKGRKLTDEHRKAISDGMKRRSDLTVLEECRRVAAERWSWMANVRIREWKANQLLALRMGNKTLFADIKKSGGWARKRRIKRFPGVTDGFTGAELRAAYAASYGGKKVGYRGEP